MSHVEELRAAATKLRETARGTTPGPWGVETVVKDSIGVYSYPGCSFVATIGNVTADTIVARDAAWIVLAGPAIAGPLADVLDGCAAGWDGCRAHVRLLTVARALNGATR